LADIYLHFPRGTNNRLNENNQVCTIKFHLFYFQKNNNRANNKRLFDSQNGGTGGYNVGDVTAEPHKDYAGQNKAVYFQSGELAPSEISIEWFNQHGCGVADKNDANWINCQIVIQYMCQDSASTRVKNGLTTETAAFTVPPDTEQFHNETIARRDGDLAAKPDAGMHESWESYDACYRRERNRGLFTADKILGRTKGATRSRQNSGGTRYGYECTEEKDYFPYWHPSEWTDIAIMTSEPTKCESIVNNSGNRVVKHECVHYIDEDTVTGWSEANTEDLCEMKGGKWVGFQQFKEILGDLDELECTQMIQKNRNVRWAVPYLPGAGRYIAPKEQCLMLHPEPECVVPPKMRPNHNGNVEGGGLPSFKWDLPHYEAVDFSKECALRIRYNITTNDFPDDFTTEQTETFYNSPEIWPNPVVNYKDVDLKLAINTAQFGRTFQDRTHVFQLLPRPASIPDDHKIYNVGVRGRRGNAAQTYPAVEYDFSPSIIEIESHDLVHFQWEGSNTVPSSTGQGKDGTDRNNIVPMLVPNSNIPAGFIADQRQNDDLPVDHFSVEENGETKIYYVRSSHGATLAEIPDVCHSFGMSMPIPTSEAYNEALKNYWRNADGVWKGDFPVGVHGKIMTKKFPI